MIVGIAALAVPGSSPFASEFLILLGDVPAGAGGSGRSRRWWWCSAAMYMLRWISAVLHDRQGPAVAAENPPDLLPASGGGAVAAYDGMAFVPLVGLVGVVLALSFYPNMVTERLQDPLFALTHDAVAQVVPRMKTPDIQWLALAPELILLGGAGVLLLAAVVVRDRLARDVALVVGVGCLIAAAVAPSRSGTSTAAAGR